MTHRRCIIFTRHFRWRPYLWLPFFLLVLGCSEDPVSPKEDVVAGVSLDSLFAPPTTAELNAVKNDWHARNPHASDVTSVDSGSYDGFEVRILSHRVGGVTHIGAVMYPPDAPGSSLPVLVLLHGGDDGINLDQYLLLLQTGDENLFREFVVVVPSFRSESLVFNGERYISGGEPSPWDRDVDDALALIDAALQVIPSADFSRIGLLGYSRGAGVGLLMGIRDPRIDLIVEFFGPTDFLGEYVRHITREALEGNLRDLPGLNYLNAHYLQPLKDGQLTLDAVRMELIRRSAVYFAAELPDLQVHHGINDTVVGVSQAERLIEAMGALGRTPPEFESYLYDGGTHNPFTLEGSTERTGEFLQRLLMNDYMLMRSFL